MDYLKLFDTHSQYEEFAGGGGMLRPNVSHCVSENEVHYNPIETRLIVKYNVANASQPTLLYYYYAEGEEEYWTRGVDMFTNVEIDGTEVSLADLDATQGTYQLSVGEHTIKYTLKDPTFIGYVSGTLTNGATFYDSSSITSVEIPNSVTTIGGGAFQGCSSLTSVTIPNSVTSIGDSAFLSCTGFTSVSIGNSVTSIGNMAFGYCSSLTSVTIPNSVTSIESAAFYDCNGLTSVTIGNSVTTIEEEAFRHCINLTSVTIPSSVTTIGSSAFCECSSLDENSRNAIIAINPLVRFDGCGVE